ncbi:MAG: SPOR domain-containing protein [Bacteroidota bacterium]
MNAFSSLFLLFILLFIHPLSTAQGKTHRSKYREDLTRHRIKFPTRSQTHIKSKNHSKRTLTTRLQPKHDITQELDTLLQDLKAYYAMLDTVQGYTIQVYTGRSRARAMQIKQVLDTHYAPLQPEINYKQPCFTVRIGSFLDRLEAYKMYVQVKSMIPQAIVRPAYFPNKPHVFDSIKAIQAPSNKTE